MAVLWRESFIFLAFVFQIYLCNAQFSQYDATIPLVTIADCGNLQYYDISELRCVDCSQNTTEQTQSQDGTGCKCPVNYRTVQNFGAGTLQCAQCVDPTPIVSSNGYECVACPGGVSNGTHCASCPNLAGRRGITYERNLQGDLATDSEIQCADCSADSYANAAGDRCVKCTTVLPVSPGQDCICTGVETGGFCFPSSSLEGIDTNGLYIIPRTTEVASEYFTQNLRASYAMCRTYLNITACQALANMCVLTLYEYSEISQNKDRACNLYYPLVSEAQERSLSPDNTPWIYYFDINGLTRPGDDVVLATSITTQFRFHPAMYIDYRVAKYSLDGKFLGISDVFDGLLQLCPDTPDRLKAAFRFGTKYSQSCSIPALNLWNTNKYPLEFYDLYLLINDNELMPVPVNILNYRKIDGGQNEVNRDDENVEDWQLFRRFFMVDNEATKAAGDTEAPMVRYAQSIAIDIELQEDTTEGKIYMPYIKIDYGSVTKEEADAGASVEASFTVTYSKIDNSYERNFQIATGTLSTLGVLYAGYRTWVWSKRAGRLAIDFSSIISFIFFAAGSLSNVFFVITFGLAFYWLVFYKNQDVVYLVHPEGTPVQDWLGLFGAAFALKCLQVIHIIFSQCTVDLFFIDWERSRGVLGNSAADSKQKEVPVSIWRTYFCANEWNEIQACRKINKVFQIFAVVFFLMVVGFENVTTEDPDGNVRKSDTVYKAETSRIFRYGVSVCIYLVVGVIQWVFFTFIYERFVEDKIRNYVDLCSISNISVFVMHHAQWGYYIHGRSVHGKADTNMREMFEMMKKEEADMVGQRGLEPNTDQQSFAMALPKKLRQKYEQVILPAQLEAAGAAGRMDAKSGGRLTGGTEKQVEAYLTMNRFFSAFIDHSLRDIDYVVKDKTFLESIMDTEFFDANETGIFYNDDGHSFDQVLFYGHEITLLLFDTLTFCIADLIFSNFVLAGVITYIITELVCLARDSLGRKNLAKKTLVDERFLI